MMSGNLSPRVVIFRLFLGICFVFGFGNFALAQNGYDKGTPAESKSGLAGMSTYSHDKIESVNLANSNLAVNIPLVTIGGRGGAGYTLTLSHNSKVWSPQHSQTIFDDGFGNIRCLDHYSATYDDAVGKRPNVVMLGGGWDIAKGPAIKVDTLYIDPHTGPHPQQNLCNGDSNTVYSYVLTKVHLVLLDGSEIELRDDLTDGSPSHGTLINGTQRIDTNRGKVWHSTDGSHITYITDADNGAVAQLSVGGYTRQLAGWVFLPDGTRLRMEGGDSSDTVFCTKVLDAQGNFITIQYNTPTGATTYTDQLGRQVVLQGSSITIKGYNGMADRVINVSGGQLGATDGSGDHINLRSDLWSLPHPIISGDYYWDPTQTIDHLYYGSNPHTDLFSHGDSDASYEEMDYKTVVTRLDLLDGRSFRFHYNQFGELAEIIYPGGGVSQFDYGAAGTTICEASGTMIGQLNRGIIQRRTLSDGITVDAVWTYTRGYESLDGGQTLNPVVTIEAHQSSVSGSLLASEKHYFQALDSEYRRCSLHTGSDGTMYERFGNGREFRVVKQTGNGVQTVNRTWQQRATVSWPADSGSSVNAYVQQWGQEQPPNDPRMVREDTILENGFLKRVDFTYDDYNNVTSEVEYDFGTSPNPGAIIRQTLRTYASNLNGYCYTNLNGSDGSCGTGVSSDPNTIIHQRHLLLSEEVQDGAGNRKAYHTVEYDNYGSDGLHAAVSTNSGMIEWDGTRFGYFNSSYQPRGNVTSLSVWAGGTSYITTYAQYDNCGHVVRARDANGNWTAISYNDNFGDGTSPDAGASGPNGPTYAMATMVTNALGQQSKVQYDYTRGIASGSKDANGVISRTEYDVVDRPIRVTTALGLPEQAIAESSYPTAASNTATVSKQLDGTRWLASRTQFDGYGRAVLSDQSEDGQHASVANFTIHSKTLFDGLDRVRFKTNPYRATAATTDGWSRATYDLAGRVTETATFSGDVNTPPPDTGTNAQWTGSVISSYNGNQTTVTDQAGKARTSTTDGLGRLVQVAEDPSVLNYLTNYTYDAPGNLTQVSQGSQTRTFNYSSLARLTSATNPESGTVSYTYDNNGNLLTKTDARSITTTMTYDSLNRPKTKTYSDATQPVYYFYDGDTLPTGAPSFSRGYSVGRLVAITYGKDSSNNPLSLGDYYGYDPLGKPLVRWQQMDNGLGGVQGYSIGATYNLGGMLLSETYPSGRTVTMTFDNAGRVSSLASGGTTMLSSINYAPQGGLLNETYGNGNYHSLHYNSRLQPDRISLGTSSSLPANIMDLQYGYGTTNNNGNIQNESIYVSTSVWTQTFTYDDLNRLTQAQESGPGGGSWTQTFSYDRYGNRTGATSNVTGVTTNAPTIDAATNRFVLSGTNFTYDSAGNLTHDNAHSYGFDAENHVTSLDGSSNQYVYDGEGKRIRKAPTDNLRMVYGISGNLIAEYDHGSNALKKEYIYGVSGLVATIEPTAGTKYLTADHLGSPRVVMDSSGMPSRHDYLPFGEEIPAGVDGRTTGNGWGQFDGERQKFTSKERDTETGLDFFGARYYGSSQGRFTSTDPLEVILGRQGADDKKEAEKEFRSYLSQPQHWNRYTYCLNNPLRFTDPDGFDPITINVNIVWDEKSKYTDAEKDEIRKSYVAEAEKNFAGIDIQLNITESTGTASIGITNEGPAMTGIASGAIDGALNVFFSKQDIGPSTEHTFYNGGTKGQIFVQTGCFLVCTSGDLTHGMVHALGIVGGLFGYLPDPHDPLEKVGMYFSTKNYAELRTLEVKNYLYDKASLDGHYDTTNKEWGHQLSKEISIIKRTAQNYLYHNHEPKHRF